MKNLVFFLFLGGWACMPLQAQQAKKKIDTKEFEVLKVQSIDDFINTPNFHYIVMNNEVLNHPSTAYFLNSEYVHSWIGINSEKCKKITKGRPIWETTRAPQDSFFVTEGKAFQTYQNLVCEKYKPQLITLWDVQKKYIPKARLENCFFLIDEYLLTKDLIRYKLDSDYMDQVEILSPRQIQSLEKGKYFNIYIVHLYTQRKVLRHSAAFQTENYAAIGVHNSRGVDTVKMLSLREVYQKYVPNTESPESCLFMINEQVITSNLEELRIAADYIHTVRVYPFTELEPLNGGHAPVSIVRIYVKDAETVEASKGKITWGLPVLLNYESDTAE